ncbi:rab-GTPase-TBC domain-containing protein, partial [Phycomyces blakesleeanus]
EFWSKVISDFESVAKSEPKILSLHLQRGIPPSLRGMMWQLLAKSKSDRLEEEYLQLLREESVYEKAITRDLLRTFPYHPYFQGQEGQNALFNVVKAYSLYDADVGYCQGLSFIAGPLLLNMPEEEAFGVLVQLMTRFTLRGHFTPQMDLLHKRLYQLDGLLADTLPHIHRHFQAQGIQSGMYASQWYMTLFAYKFPLEVVFRIYDTILADGLDILHRVALALITKNQAILLSMEFDCLLNHLKEDMLAVYEDDVNELVREAYSISLSPKRLERLSKEYSVELIKANSEAEIISDLRRQNKALAETVRQLERITKQLENEHALVAKQLQVSNAQQLELQQTNSKLQQQVFDLSNALEILPKTIESRVREEMEILCTKNGALVQRNAALEDQLVYMETMVIDMKVKYAESENERETLQQRLADLKRWMVTESVF